MAAKIGLVAAVDYALGLGLARHPRPRGRRSRSGCATAWPTLPGVSVRDLGGAKCGIVTFDAAAALARWRRADACGPAGSTSASPPRPPPGSTWTPAASTEMVRASVHYYNTEDEVDLFCREVRGLL